ncbi:MAG: EAL domain-containing protein [Lachnospiraceae bacterium]|nr:EAL domain-containing protein [Lachnospiraceae bacterium]
MGSSFFTEFFSPLTAALAVVLIIACLKTLDRFKYTAFLMMLGIASWAVADIILFFNNYILHTEPLTVFVRNLYVFPNYFFGLSIATFLYLKLPGKDLLLTAINTFVISIVGFVCLRKLLQLLTNESSLDTHTYLRVYLYFFINFFIIVLGARIIYLMGSSMIKRGTNLIVFGILAYIVLDFQYTYVEALGDEPENIYLDLLYMLFMVLMSLGILIQSVRQYAYSLKQQDYSEKSFIRNRAFILIGAFVALLLCISGFFTQTEFFYILIALLAYLIMISTYRSNMLSEDLLEKERELTTSLEEQVAAKTSDLQRANDELEKLSSTDILTGLYNRRHASRIMEKLSTEANENDSIFAVFSIDLNHFKPINDTYGHDMGDKVLAAFGERMLRLPDNYISFRTGGDEFLILCSGFNDRGEIESAARRIQTLFNTPLIVENYIFNLSGSIGISSYPEDSTRTDALLQYADAAMYEVKQSHRRDDFKFFDFGLFESTEKRRLLESFMRDANPAKDFTLEYQPQIDVFAEEIVGMEVFPRLNNAVIGDYSPAELIPIAEETGLMNRLGIWIADTALRQCAVWRGIYKKPLTVTINLSPLQLLDSEFIETLINLTEELCLPPSDVILDVSNEVIMGAADSAADTLNALEKYGFVLSINEFGGGDINLSYVLKCGFSVIKLARSLVDGIEKNESSAKLVGSIASLARTLNIDLTAVGIENEEQDGIIKDFGIRHAQGYFYGKPKDASSFEALLASR